MPPSLVRRCLSGHPLSPKEYRDDRCRACEDAEREAYSNRKAREAAAEDELIRRSIPEGDMVMRSHDGSVQRFRVPKMPPKRRAGFGPARQRRR